MRVITARFRSYFKFNHGVRNKLIITNRPDTRGGGEWVSFDFPDEIKKDLVGLKFFETLLGDQRLQVVRRDEEITTAKSSVFKTDGL